MERSPRILLTTPWRRRGRGFLYGNPLVRPFRDGVHRGRERSSLPGKRVLHPDGRFWNHRPLDNPFLLELLKALTQHPVRDVGNGVA